MNAAGAASDHAADWWRFGRGNFSIPFGSWGRRRRKADGNRTPAANLRQDHVARRPATGIRIRNATYSRRNAGSLLRPFDYSLIPPFRWSRRLRSARRLLPGLVVLRPLRLVIASLLPIGLTIRRISTGRKKRLQRE